MYHPDNIDPSNPIDPNGSFFNYFGDTGIAQPYFSGKACVTLEQFYQAIKARMFYELIQEGGFNPSAKIDRLLNLSGDDETLNEMKEIENDEDKPRRGRPRLSDMEKHLRLELRKLNSVGNGTNIEINKNLNELGFADSSKITDDGLSYIIVEE